MNRISLVIVGERTVSGQRPVVTGGLDGIDCPSGLRLGDRDALLGEVIDRQGIGRHPLIPDDKRYSLPGQDIRNDVGLEGVVRKVDFDVFFDALFHIIYSIGFAYRWQGNYSLRLVLWAGVDERGTKDYNHTMEKDILTIQTAARSDRAPSARVLIDRLVSNIEKVIIGKPRVVRLAVTTLLAGGHLLIEDVPGVGKTTLAAAIAKSVGGSFMRIQFTSDMLPSDIIGVSVLRKSEDDFEFIPGPIFHNFVLADEINRTSPRTQSALLEAMSDAKVSVENRTYEIRRPFMILATQNPLEYHGTYPLPESQLDRFMMTVEIGYPESRFERVVVSSQDQNSRADLIGAVLTLEELSGLQELVETIAVDEDLLSYLMGLVEATRTSKHLKLGVSTRGAIFLRKAAQVSALMEGRDYLIPDDIKGLVLPIFSHRVVTRSLSHAGIGRSREARDVLSDIVESVPVPL
jgi:MoxR-like ATPase